MKKKFNLSTYDELGLCNLEEVFEPLTVKQAVIANCFQCGGFELSNSYKCDIVTCPLRQFNNKWVKKSFQKPRILSDEDREKRRINAQKNLARK